MAYQCRRSAGEGPSSILRSCLCAAPIWDQSGGPAHQAAVASVSVTHTSTYGCVTASGICSPDTQEDLERQGRNQADTLTDGCRVFVSAGLLRLSRPGNGIPEEQAFDYMSYPIHLSL